MKYDEAFFDQVLNRCGTRCEKWDDPARVGADSTAMWVADMDFFCAEPIVNALMERVQHPCYGYNIADGSDEKALVSFWQRRHGVTMRAEQITMLPCVVTGLRLCIRALTKPGDGVAVFTPVYGPFLASVRENDRKLISVPLVQNPLTNRFDMNYAGMEQALREGAKLIMLCNPHNPVSRLWGAEELQKLNQLAEKYQVPIVSDEIHADFVYQPGSFISMLDIPGAAEHTIMLCAASKTFNIAGLQQASCVCKNPEILEKIVREKNSCGVECGNTFALAATAAAYTQCDDWLDGVLAYLDGNRKLLAELLAQKLPLAKLTPVEATYLCWIDLRYTGKSSEQLVEMLKQAGVVVNPGTDFGPEGDGFIRLNIGCPKSQLVRALDCMEKALKGAEV